jgi:predicted DNA-binding transcriptional regulator YafY
VNRTDRLYALVEELRAVAPRPRSAAWLAARFEVSGRTVERDISALQQSGVPIWAEPGRTGGYCLDRAHTLPPVNFTPEEATALAIALARPAASPLGESLRSALHKVVAAMPSAAADAAQRLAGRVALLPHASDTSPPAARTVEQALIASRVLEIDYEDKNGERSHRQVEPAALVGSGEAWYLVGYCRLRSGGRSFRLDRIVGAALTDEPAPDRDPESLSDIPSRVRRLSLLE